MRIHGRGSGRKVTDDHSRLSAAMHVAAGTKAWAGTKARKKPIPKRGTDAKKPTSEAAAPKRGLSESLLSAIKRRLAR